MEFRFDDAQLFQLSAIAAAIGLLEGQVHIGATLIPAAGSTVVPNRLDLSEDHLLENLCNVQAENGIDLDATLGVIEHGADNFEGKGKVRFPNFSIEMETGTGKT